MASCCLAIYKNSGFNSFKIISWGITGANEVLHNRSWLALGWECPGLSLSTT